MSKTKLAREIAEFLEAEEAEIGYDEVYDQHTTYGYQNILLSKALRELKK